LKRILLTGISGQVGRELQRTLQPLGDVIACDRSRFDLTQPEALRATLQALRPTLIVNPAAYTAVDKAESEPDLAMTINATAPAVLAEFAREADALLVHFSTDYVFAGDQPTAYSEDDIPAPLGVYGRSKLAGEQAITASGCRHLIFRTSWVYGLHGHNFLKTMLRLAQERDELRVVDDQFGAPTWSRMIAETVAAALARYQGQHGIYSPPRWRAIRDNTVFTIAAPAASLHGTALPRPSSTGPIDRACSIRPSRFGVLPPPTFPRPQSARRTPASIATGCSTTSTSPRQTGKPSSDSASAEKLLGIATLTPPFPSLNSCPIKRIR